MVKKILFLIVIVAFGFALWQGYNYFQKVQSPVLSSFNAIPPSAVAVFQFKNIESTWGKMIASNKMWSDLLHIKSFETINEGGDYLKKIVLKNGEFRKILKEKPLVISLHLSGAETYDYLYCISLPNTKNPTEIKTEIISLLKENQVLSTKNYGQDEIYSLSIANLNSILYFTIKNHILIFSFSSLLIEEAIRNLNLPAAERANDMLAEIEKSTSINTDGNIYVNYNLLGKLVSKYIKNAGGSANFFKSNFASWGGFDLTIEANAVGLNGFTYTKDSTNNYIDLFKTQQPQEVQITPIVPSNTSYLLHYGYSDFQLFLKNYREFLDRDNSLFTYQKNIIELEQDCGCDIQNSALGWVGNESAVLITESTDENIIENKFILFSVEEIEKALEQLAELSLQIKDTVPIPSIEEYKNFSIYGLPIHNLYEELLGESFANTDIRAYISIDNYIIFGHSNTSLKSFINQYNAQKTLANDEAYLKQLNYIEDKSNIFLYTNISRSTQSFKKYIKSSYLKDYESNKVAFEKFDAFIFQCSNFKENLFYTNIVFQHNPKDHSNSKINNWQVDLGKKIVSAPVLLDNHLNHEKEIFIQDVEDNIYLVNAEGKILWQKMLPERIMGKVSQIDIFKNNKLQIIFNTKNFIFMLDRNGKDLEGTPIKLPSPATSEVAILDYDKSRDYRFIIACENKNIYNFGIDGKPIPSWKAERTTDIVESPAQHVKVQEKDYVFIVEKSGKINLLDRQGKKRADVKDKLLGIVNQPTIMGNSKEIEATNCIFLNKKGELIKQSFGGNKKVLYTNDDEVVSAQMTAFDKDGNFEIILQYKKKLIVLGREGNIIFEQNISAKTESTIQKIIDPKSKTINFVYFDAEEKSIVILDDLGNKIKIISTMCDGKFVVGGLKNDDVIDIISIDGTIVYKGDFNEE